MWPRDAGRMRNQPGNARFIDSIKNLIRQNRAKQCIVVGFRRRPERTDTQKRGDASLEGENLIARQEMQMPEDIARRFLVRGLAICALIWVGLYNGYPTVFSDTGSYLLTGKFFVALAPFRAPGYSVFTNLASFGSSAWFVIVIQAVLVAYVLHLTCIHLLDGARKFADYWFLAGIGVMAALTSLPWTVSLLMPDVFAGVLFLAAYLLAFSDTFRPLQRIFLATILAISVAAHASLFPIAALLIAGLVLHRYFAGPAGALPSAKALVGWLLIPFIFAGLLTAELNREMNVGFRISPSGNAFLLARLFGDGLAADYLRDTCQERHFYSCRYLSHLPRTQGEFLFWHPLYPELLKGRQAEMDEIVRGAISAYPARFAISSLKESILQFTNLRTGDEIRSYGAKEWNSGAVPRVFPGDVKAFGNSRQYHDRLTSLADAAARIDTAMFWLSLAACVAFARMGRNERKGHNGRMNTFFYASLFYLVINASVCASFAGVYDRYQSRVAWIVPFCLTAFLGIPVRDWKPWKSTENVEELEVGAE